MLPPRIVTAALVGAGRIARVHEAYLAAAPAAELVAVCDPDPQAGSEMSARAGVPAYASLDEMLHRAAPEVVHIVTPPALHVPLAVQAMNAGAHVMIEKPMAVDPAGAERLRETAARNRVWLTADHNRLFDPPMMRLRHLIEMGHLGEIIGAEVFQGAGVDGEEHGSGWKSELPGGAMHDVAPHPAYQLRFVTGTPREVRVVAEHDTNGALSEVRMVVRGERASGTLTLSRQARPAVNRLHVFGSRGSAEVNFNTMSLVVHRDKVRSKIAGKVLPPMDTAYQIVRETVSTSMQYLRGRQRFYPGMGNHIRVLYDRLARGLPPPVSAEEACDVVTLCAAMWTPEGSTAGSAGALT